MKLEDIVKRTVPDLSELTEAHYKDIRSLWAVYGSGYLINVLRHFDYLAKVPDVFSPERYEPNSR